MASPLNISIPPLTEGQRIEDWQPLFIAATSSLVANANEKVAIQILPSFVCRNYYEQSTVLQAIKEETLQAAFTLLCASLDPPIDEFEAATLFRKMQWARGIRVEVFFDQLRKQAKRAGYSNRAACAALVGELPREAQSLLKGWIKGKEECTEKDTREFVTLVQTTLLQKGMDLDHGARLIGGSVIRITDGRDVAPSGNQTEDTETKIAEEVCRVHVSGRPHRGATDQGQKYRKPRFNCFTCGKLGHGWSSCPERICEKCHNKGHGAYQCRGDNARKQSYRGGRDVYRAEYEGHWDEGSATISVQIEERTTRALLDTGARINVMDVSTMKELKLEGKLIHTPGCIFGVCKTPVQVLGYLDASIKVPNESTRLVRIQVLEGEDQALLLGRQFMHQFGRVIFDWRKGTIELGRTTIPISTKAIGGDPLERAKAVKQISDGGILSEPKKKIVNPELTISQQKKVELLIEEYESTFSEKPGRTSMCEHAIITGDALPTKNRPRRQPPRWEEEINRQLDELLRQNLCRPSCSPWASNVVLVSKKDGKQRFTIDYRRLNDVTKKDAYSIPQIQAILDKLNGYRFFSVIDISSAYWCVPVRECDVEKTAFNTPRGLYEMTVMPFGLVNSQATFQRMMDNALRGLKHTESYVDDCIIYSRTFEGHLSDLREVLERLKQARIHVKFRKCQLGYAEVEFLGHMVSSEGRRAIPAASERLSKFPRPRCVKELQRFLGSLNFYRSYIPDLATVAEPLYQLTKKGAPWDWSRDSEAAFDCLRNKLVKEPVLLTFPDWSKDFVVETDASTNAVAAVLSQRDESNGHLRPIEYFSSSLTLAQRNYSAGQLEAWALVAACRKWNVYLKGSDKVELVTDHNPLCWLRSQRDPRRTFARWILELEEYNYEVTYRPGTQNSLPDYLSRVPGQEVDAQVQDECHFEEKIFTAQQANMRLSDMREDQRKDKVISDAYKEIAETGEVQTGQLKNVTRHLHIQEGILYFDERLVVPKRSQRAVLSEVHTAGHFGQARTLQLLRRSFFWRGMAREVNSFCRGCITCSQAKPSNVAKQPLEQFDISGIGPGDLIALDVATLPWSDGDYRHFLCIVDVFTRYIEAIPLKDQKAISLVKEFEAGWIYRGHGVPKALLTDQGPNVDGKEIREMCEKFGIEKRHTSPYHPQADGLAERSIGLVKQVARCLTLERELGKGAWPSLLPEVTFYCNNVENSSTKFAAQLLNTGRLPTSPIDAWIRTHEDSAVGTHQQYLDSLLERKKELLAMAAENDRLCKRNVRERSEKRVRRDRIKVGDFIFERNETRSNSLDPKFKGPFRVMGCRGVNVKIDRGRGPKWIHLDRCKLYKGGEGQVIIPSDYRINNPDRESEAKSSLEDTSGTLNEEGDSPLQRNNITVPDEPASTEESEGPVSQELNRSEYTNQSHEPIRRYPLRERRPKKYTDYVTLGSNPKGPH